MPWPSDPTVRMPVVAGAFYPGDAQQCRAAAQAFVQKAVVDREKAWFGGIVAHAGWPFSGALAGQTLATLAAQGKPDVIVVFGAVHSPYAIQSGALDSHRAWALPTGSAAIHADLQSRLLQKGNVFAVDDRLHAREHSIEVVLPIVQQAFADVPIVPIAVPVSEVAELIGRKTVQAVQEAGLKAICLASTDLTHYGPNYRFMPVGVGEAAMEWSRQNDWRLLKLIENMDAPQIVPEVRAHHNACGGGAVAALLAACRVAGATKAKVLSHTTSYEVLKSVAPQAPDCAVGYASVVVG